MAGIARFFRRHFDSAADLDLHTKDDATDATAAAAGSAPTTPPSACQAHRLRTQSLDDEFGELPDVLLSHDDFPASPDSVLSTPQFEDAHQDLHKCEPQPRETTVAAAAAAAVIAAAANASARSLSPSFAASSVPPAAAPPPPPLPPPTILSAATSAKPVKAPRRSSSSSSSLLPFIIPFATAVAFGGGGAGETTPAVQSSLQNAFTSTDQAGRQRSDSKHQHTPSLNFDGDGHLLGSAFPDLLERSAAVSSDDADDDTGAGAGAGNAGLLLDDYALFDLLGDSDPAVMDMFSHVVAALEAITRDGGALTSAQGTPQAARARASARSSPSSPPPVDKVAECTGGVYVLGNNDAVFKPRCEEAMHPPLPQMRPLAIGEPNPLRRGFQVGDGAAREVAAYQLDRAAGHFARVPPTTLVSVRSDVTSGTDGAVARTGAPRLEGSLQKYMTNSGSSEDYGSSTFGLERVQAIALLDVRLFNTDRHGGNLLVTDDGGGEDEAGACKKGLVPIDHGLCLPDFQHLGEFEAEWLFWREARAPLLPAARAHVAALDDDRDAALLRGLGFRAQSVLTLRLLTRFLKFTALELDWTLHDIGAFLTRSHLTPTQPTLTTQQHDGHGARSKFQALLGRAADAAVAAGGDTSLPGFLRGDVPFSDERARHLLAAAERQWRLELSEEA